MQFIITKLFAIDKTVVGFFLDVFVSSL